MGTFSIAVMESSCPESSFGTSIYWTFQKYWAAVHMNSISVYSIPFRDYEHNSVSAFHLYAHSNLQCQQNTEWCAKEITGVEDSAETDKRCGSCCRLA